MSKSRNRDTAPAPGSTVSQPAARLPKATGAEARRARDSGLLERILETPRAVQRLQPELLHRVIQRVGLEDCGELVALATPEQLRAIFDLDLWHADQPGTDEQFDAERFGVWLEVLVEAGEEIAARRLAELDAGLVVTGLSHHVRVFDLAALYPSESEDGDELAPPNPANGRLTSEIGGYLIVATSSESWDAIVAALAALDTERPDSFRSLMRQCVALSNDGFEVDGSDDLPGDREQAMFDLTFDREQRREQQGFASPAQARAFLQSARQLDRGLGSRPPTDAVARAYFRALESADGADAGRPEHTSADPDPAASRRETATSENDGAEALAEIVEALADAGLLPQQPRGLLQGSEGPASHSRLIQTLMESARERDRQAFETRGHELAFLANTLVAGCPLQGRPMRPQEASDAAVAICNLGLENWPAHWSAAAPTRAGTRKQRAGALPDDFLVQQDLVGAFQIGWAVLYEEVCMRAAERLVRTLTDTRTLASDTQQALVALRLAMKRHWKAGTPWHAREAMDVLAILDMPAWAAMLGLIDECPTLHAALAATERREKGPIGATAFEFISENSQIDLAHAFLDRLPQLLAG
jgi:hypothetical protein